jgi:hypothetical protein
MHTQTQTSKAIQPSIASVHSTTGVIAMSNQENYLDTAEKREPTIPRPSTADTHSNRRMDAQYYEESACFLELFEAGHFDEEVDTDIVWMGFIRNESGELELHAEFMYAANGESGWGWFI